MMLDTTTRYDERLPAERLFGWHVSLFPSGQGGLSKIKTGGRSTSYTLATTPDP